MAKTSFFRRRVIDPAVALLKQGLTPDLLALSLVSGVAWGVFPVLGTTTALCAVFALVLRLNQPAIQFANYVVYPLQLLLLIPFMRLGVAVVGLDAELPDSAQAIVMLVQEDPVAALRDLWSLTWRAVLAWSLVAVPASLLGYWVLRAVLRHGQRRWGRGGVVEATDR